MAARCGPVPDRGTAPGRARSAGGARERGLRAWGAVHPARAAPDSGPSSARGDGIRGVRLGRGRWEFPPPRWTPGCGAAIVAGMDDSETPSPGGTSGPPETGGRRGITPTPHDALFRALVADPARARALLRDHLPDRIAGRLADRPPRILDGSFIDEALRGSQSDLLMEVETAAGHPALVYVLAEHKSTPSPGVALQLAGYMVRVWERHAQGRAERLRNLPPIIPLVLYSGQSRWAAPEGLAEMIAGDDPELVFLPGERFLFRWLARMAPGDLSGDAQLRAGFLALTRRALALLEELDAALAENPALRKAVAVYIFSTSKGRERARLEDRLAALAPEETEGILGTIAETLRAEGEARGIAKGEARSLVRLLERRFGPLPDADRRRIAGATLDQLDRWFDRGLDAGTLEAVFAGG